jgi:hypothetical protein
MIMKNQYFMKKISDLLVNDNPMVLSKLMEKVLNGTDDPWGRVSSCFLSDISTLAVWGIIKRTYMDEEQDQLIELTEYGRAHLNDIEKFERLAS